jgi:hypothetical protein
MMAGTAMNEPIFQYRQSGTTGCEIIGPDGTVIARTIDAAWAGLIVGLLNCFETNGLSAVTLSQDGQHMKNEDSLP